MRNYIKLIVAGYLIFLCSSCTSELISDNLTTIDSTYFNVPSYSLKSYAVANVGNSNYSFTYDLIGRLNTINHASDLDQYKCFYNGKVLYKMINQNPFTSSDTIKYFYEQQLLSRIEIAPQNTGTPDKLILNYDNLKRVISIDRFKLENSIWQMYRKLVFTYDLDNNISTYKNYYSNGGTLTLLDETTYTLYDDKINPKTNFFISEMPNEYFVYIPYLKLQINNPINETLLRGTTTFMTQHNYSYHNNLPTVDNKVISIISNNGAPFIVQGTEFYEYY